MYSDLIPDEIQAELISIKESILDQSFRLGDIAKDCASRNPEQAKIAVYRAVGSFCGKKSRSVREYADIAEFYPEPIRKRFEVLSFDHFRTAYKRENSKTMLEWAVEQGDTFGRPATVDAMIAEFCYTDGKDILIIMIEKLRDWVERLPEKITPEQRKQVAIKVNEIEEILVTGPEITKEEIEKTFREYVIDA